MAHSPYFDTLETRPAPAREAALMAALPQAIAQAMAHAPAVAAQLAGCDPARIDTRQALAALPVLRKSELLSRQQVSRDTPGENGPGKAMGGFSALGWGQAVRVFASPGPIYEPESARRDYWRFGRALYAAGIRPGELVHNCFSYHFTPAGSMMETAAHAIGCTVFPGGTGQTEQQVRAIRDLGPTAYTGTPSFLKMILEKADELREPLPSLRHALVSGEAFPPPLRDWLGERGIDAYQAYGSADLGLIAYETPAREGLVLGEDIIVEIVRPGTGDPVPDGEVGEVVVTTLNPDYPLVRFGTGDLSAVLPGQSPCGRTNTRIRGWLGRADQATKVRGLFVHPSQVAEILRRHPEAGRGRLVVGGEPGADVMTLHVEVSGEPPGLAQAIARSVRDVAKLRAEVRLCAPGTLPNDGKIIEDTRRYT
ncbi:phenylacetate--CoA ligase family protein [Bordetella genomosp. 9]|uniref:AMP-dependent synthetase n=1 Tax=Bordetella genomosp. 9 TaxID=1416803 RepID=A0A1W6Z4K2_9BORD|nr:AMP-binding protein [Bordetella genomosp. 9]ARP88191.1 AMP-dependent synthetase [Bordetella genomosp. 9]